jgi:peptidoglycan glycosyltransferase
MHPDEHGGTGHRNHPDEHGGTGRRNHPDDHDDGALMERRIRRLGIVMVLCFLVLFVQLNNIQIVKANSLATATNNPRVLAVARDDARGDILSADGVVLASSVPSNGYYKYQRIYNPNTAVLFSQIVGYDSIIYGKTGIEDQYDSSLESHTRPAKTLRDLLVNRTTTGNVTLTISSTLQSQVAQAVDNTDIKGSAPQAGAVVINIKTGAIEAMYSNPTFDPSPLVSPNIAMEKYAWAALDPQSAQSQLVSRTFQYGFLPGSTFKTVTSAAVYDHQPALAKLNVPVAGCISLEPQSNLPLCNYGHNGPNGPEHCGGVITVTLPASCDTAFATLGMDLGGASLTAEAQAFGFNQNVPIDLPGAGMSKFPAGASFNLNKPSQAYSAFGQQNVVATALQMALVADGIANRGVIMTPHVMRDIHDSSGTLITSYTPHPWLTATNPLTAAAVTSLMQGVVTNGTATQVGFPRPWNVAAKTGTAETGPNATLTNDWMIAFAPANDPKVAVAIVVPNQPGSDTGATVSGPPMKTILGDALAVTP